MITYFQNLTGANCLVGGQTIISLSVTEDMDADYDTAAAICLGAGGNLSPGQVVETVEGGWSTGLWVVDSASAIASGPKTWRRKAGEGFTHLPLVSYRLRRKGYLQARATVSKGTLGKDNYPPKFCTKRRWEELVRELQGKARDGEISFFDAYKETGSWQAVAGAGEIIETACKWVRLPIAIGVQLSKCPEEYIPVGKSIMAMCKEVAGWSGASCHLDRYGTLRVYDWQQVYNSGAELPMPASLVEAEEREGLAFPTQVTVVGKGYRGAVVERPADPGHWSASGRVWVPAQPAVSYISGRAEKAVEVTESLPLPAGGSHVEERIEITSYHIDPQLAQLIARERLSRSLLAAVSGTYSGPGEGYQAYCPVEFPIFTLNRRLNWNGSAYRYEVEITGPRVSIDWGAPSDEGGWW
ncbi:MAG: hypothetical protein JXA87_07825 [Thermoleophilia bacterium]|nr:hypothetical protein [Thermoleophilia bacterium]